VIQLPLLPRRAVSRYGLAGVAALTSLVASVAVGCGSVHKHISDASVMRADQTSCRVILPFLFRRPAPHGQRDLRAVAHSMTYGSSRRLLRETNLEITPRQEKLGADACVRGFAVAMQKLHDQQSDGYNAGAFYCREFWIQYRILGRSAEDDLYGFDPSNPLGSAINIRAYFVANGGYEGEPVEYWDAYAAGCYEAVSGAGSGQGAHTTTATASPHALPDHLVGAFEALANQQMEVAGKVFYCDENASNTREVCLYGTRKKIQGGYILTRIGSNCYKLSHTDPKGVPMVTRSYSGSDFDGGSPFYDISSSDWHTNYGSEVAGCGTQGSPPTTAQPTPTTDSVALTHATRVIEARGYSVIDSSTYDVSHVLRYLVGVKRGNFASHAPSNVFFFIRSQFIGTDLLHPDDDVAVKWSNDDTVALAYRLYRPSDAHCCPSGGTAVVRFHWTGHKLIPRDPIPSDDPNAPLHRLSWQPQ
jgi:hypothetical protein